VNLLAAEIDGKKCVPLASLDPKKPLALGSAFKLYILDALAAQIAAGKHGWDDPVAIQDAYKSLPSGDMRNEPAGKTFSVRHFAEQMISVSDNTATDHLLAFVGRGAVEDAVRASGHATPPHLVPFLSTREMFALKLLASPDDRTAYVAADVAHKRKLLDAYDRRDPLEMLARAGSFTTPIMIDSIEWPASPDDLCKLIVGLKARADAPATAPVGSILSINPGIPDDRKQYSYLGYKGGSEPGVLNLTWLLQRARDQKWVFLTVGFNDTSGPLDESKAIAAAATAREFLGR
jgi:beta-lactamase class A